MGSLQLNPHLLNVSCRVSPEAWNKPLPRTPGTAAAAPSFLGAGGPSPMAHPLILIVRRTGSEERL